MLRVYMGDLWNRHALGEWVCITTNGDINSRGQIVMGRGCAAEAKDKFSWLPNDLACRVKVDGNHVYSFTNIRLLTFPVKHHWNQRADLKLIRRSAEELADWADVRMWPRVYIPKPGCGNGGLSWSSVEPALEAVWKDLPHRFVIVDRTA